MRSVLHEATYRERAGRVIVHAASPMEGETRSDDGAVELEREVGFGQGSEEAEIAEKKQEDPTRLYIGSISWELYAGQAKEALETLCRPFSAQCEVEVPWMDRKKKKLQKHKGFCKGFAFVSFPDATIAAAALEGLSGAEVGGRAVTVKTATPPPEKRPPLERVSGRDHVKLYVGQLPVEVKDAAALKRMFESCGTVVDAKVLKDELGVSRGFGFVTMASRRAGDKALDMHGSFLDGHFVDKDKGGRVGWEEQRMPIIVNSADLNTAEDRD